ncbi:Leucine-rich repeat 2, partial [Arabidopsis suecica]
MVLSKRWRFVWTMLPKLDYTENSEGEKSVWDFLDKSLQLHKAPSLERLCIHLGQQCPVDVDVGKWVLNAVDRCVRKLILEIRFIPTADPTSLPKSLYTCKALVKLTLRGEILIDVPSSACLPSLESLVLANVMYKDQDSHVKLLSSCPVLRYLLVCRDKSDNVTRFIVKLPSLRKLTYMDLASLICNAHHSGRSLVIDSPGLNYVDIFDLGGHCSCSIQNMPRLDVATVMPRLDVASVSAAKFGFEPTIKFLRSLSSVRCLDLALKEVACCSDINFPRLIEFKLRTYYSDNWLKPLMLLLHNAPKLKALMITSDSHDHPLSWNQPSSVPGCLLSHLEIFEWKNFGESREEKQFLAYILANSKCLNTVRISLRPSKNDEEKKKITEDVQSMYRVSASSQLLF